MAGDRLDEKALEDLERLDTEATPGPWVQWDGHGTVVAGPVSRNDRRSISGHRATICEAEEPDDWDDDDIAEPEAHLTNAALIAAARTALPSLLAEVRASRSPGLGSSADPRCLFLGCAAPLEYPGHTHPTGSGQEMIAPGSSAKRAAEDARRLKGIIQALSLGSANRDAYVEHANLCDARFGKGRPCECGYAEVEAVMAECSACPAKAVEDGLCDPCHGIAPAPPSAERADPGARVRCAYCLRSVPKASTVEFSGYTLCRERLPCMEADEGGALSGDAGPGGKGGK
jgi:hypothetical protein